MNGFISTKLLGALDYIMGLLIASSPWLFGFYTVGGAALFIPIFLGVMQVLLTIFSNYELGMIKVVPMPIHNVLNTFCGFILMVSPFLYGFYHTEFLPQFVCGLIVLIMGVYAHGSIVSAPEDLQFNSRD